MKHNWFDGTDSSTSDAGTSYADAASYADTSFGPGSFGGSTLSGTEGGVTTQMALYLTETGNAASVEPTDIYQGNLGDCFLLSSFGEIAITSSSTISSMITQNSNGTETVKLYSFQSVKVGHSTIVQLVQTNETVSNSFNAGTVDTYTFSGQDVVGGVKEIWPQILEKAFAQLGGGYSSIANGGSPVTAMEELTGKAATWYTPTQLGSSQTQIVANFNSLIKAGDMIVLDTSVNNSTYGLYGDHAYMFDGLVTVGSTTYVKALNPWGFDNPSLIPVTALKSTFVEVDVGHV
jgi:hypothetical protein